MVKPLRERVFQTIHYTTIRRIVDSKDHIQSYVRDHPYCLGAKRETVVTHPEVEEALECWVEQMHKSHYPIRGDDIIQMAHQLCDMLDIPKEERIKFTDGWLNGFKRRHGLSFRDEHKRRAQPD
ncbi:Tc5 transposase DNA-binding domain protein [Ceratobasidium sp. AG-Ba]|nr:Tc5 transposase DNA-binding domain protein [Ceratobasidium sp. AG-Ba]